jgi:hypothetical protein
MKHIESCIYKENETFFVDLDKWKKISDIELQIGDMFLFTLDNVKYSAKVLSVNYTDATLKIV